MDEYQKQFYQTTAIQLKNNYETELSNMLLKMQKSGINKLAEDQQK